MKEETTPTAGLQVEDIRRVTPLIRALYMHQPVMMHPDWEAFNDDRPTMVEAHHFDDSYSKRWNGSYVLLRPLSSITDDEAVQVAKSLSLINAEVSLRDYQGITLNDDSYSFTVIFTGEVAMSKRGYAYVDRLYIAYQMFIQKGFALPLYDSVTNTTITVDMQVAAGIIKLKS